jgi:hypothetical protein
MPLDLPPASLDSSAARHLGNSKAICQHLKAGHFISTVRLLPPRNVLADETSRLVVPLAEQKIHRVLERVGDAMIILRRDEDIAVKGGNLRRPSVWCAVWNTGSLWAAWARQGAEDCNL